MQMSPHCTAIACQGLGESLLEQALLTVKVTVPWLVPREVWPGVGNGLFSMPGKHHETGTTLPFTER